MYYILGFIWLTTFLAKIACADEVLEMGGFSEALQNQTSVKTEEVRTVFEIYENIIPSGGLNRNHPGKKLREFSISLNSQGIFHVPVFSVTSGQEWLRICFKHQNKVLTNLPFYYVSKEIYAHYMVNAKKLQEHLRGLAMIAIPAPKIQVNTPGVLNFGQYVNDVFRAAKISQAFHNEPEKYKWEIRADYTLIAASGYYGGGVFVNETNRELWNIFIALQSDDTEKQEAKLFTIPVVINSLEDIEYWDPSTCYFIYSAGIEIKYMEVFSFTLHTKVLNDYVGSAVLQKEPLLRDDYSKQDIDPYNPIRSYTIKDPQLAAAEGHLNSESLIPLDP